MTRILGAIAAILALSSGAVGAGTPAPYDLRLELDFRQAAGDQGLREEFELQLISQLRSAACFRSLQQAPEDAADPPNSETLRLRIVLDEVFEETVYDASIADRADPQASDALELAHTSRLRAVVSASLEHVATGRTLRARRLRGEGAHRPLVLGEDARYIALREATAETARMVRSFVCKGGAKRLRKQLASAAAP